VGLIELELGAARVCFTDRHGGVSTPPYDTANLGFATGDDRERVRENRCRVGVSLSGAAADPAAWVAARQVHGATVLRVGGAADGGAPADALVTSNADTPLVVLTADCVPLALAGRHAVAAVHAGWRGLLAGVVEAAVAAVRGDDDDEPVQAVMGPCISAACYEFGAGDLERVAARLGPRVRARTRDGTPALDLRAGVRAALAHTGVREVADVDVCTASSHDYFSHRRDGITGRQALFVTRMP
jgi:YfiH family protein